MLFFLATGFVVDTTLRMIGVGEAQLWMSVGSRLWFDMVYLSVTGIELALAVHAEAFLVFIKCAFDQALYWLKGQTFPVGY